MYTVWDGAVRILTTDDRDAAFECYHMTRYFSASKVTIRQNGRAI